MNLLSSVDVSPENPTGNVFFKDSDDCTIIAAHILILTTCLGHTRHADSKATKTRTDTKKLSSIWRSIALILTCGSEVDQSSGRAVAVTGKLEPDGVRALIVTSNTTPVEANAEETYLHKLDVTEDISSLSQTQSGSEKEYTFKQHAAAALSIIKHLFDPKIDRKSAIATLFYFIVTRCYFKTRSRMNAWRKTWSENPFLLLQKEDNFSNLEVRTFDIRTTVFDRLRSFDHSFDSSLQDAHGHQGKSVKVQINRNTALIWAKVVRRVYDLISYHLIKSNPDPNIGERAALATTSDSHSVQELAGVMLALHHIYDLGIISHLATQNFVDRLLLSAQTRKEDKDTFEVTDTGKIDVEGANGESIDTVDPENVTEDGVDDSNNSKDPFYESDFARYIRLLLVPYTATSTLISSITASSKAGQFRNLDVHLFTSSEESRPAMGDITDLFHQFRDWFCSNHEPDLNYRPFFDRVEKEANFTFTNSVHAEATLMRLAYTQSLSSAEEGRVALAELDWLKDFNIPIGIGRKCCYCCNLLAETVNIDFNKSRTTKTAIITPGTHGLVCPWTPPPGLPKHILQHIREETFRVFKQAIASEAERLNSPSDMSSSPVSPQSSVLDDFEEYIAGTSIREDSEVPEFSVI